LALATCGAAVDPGYGARALAHREVSSPARCERLAGVELEAGVVETAKSVGAGEVLLEREMAGATISSNLCCAELRLRPVPGSEIEVEVWLPERWNGKLMGFGGAGFDGGLGPGGAPLFNQAGALSSAAPTEAAMASCWPRRCAHLPDRSRSRRARQDLRRTEAAQRRAGHQRAGDR
jgi:hypothetical protein